LFTGIIETLGKVLDIKSENTNKHFIIHSSIAQELKIDQSVAHNGVCLTVVSLSDDTHTVTAIDETLQKTAMNELKIGSSLNLERCLPMNGRLDGHIVQGHVDCIAKCISISDENGSWKFTFEYDFENNRITVEKGSICINGISLTVVDSGKNTFSVAIIPYTYKFTNMKNLKIGERVNLEFDIIGKYVAKLLSL